MVKAKGKTKRKTSNRSITCVHAILIYCYHCYHHYYNDFNYIIIIIIFLTIIISLFIVIDIAIVFKRSAEHIWCHILKVNRQLF